MSNPDPYFPAVLEQPGGGVEPTPAWWTAYVDRMTQQQAQDPYPAYFEQPRNWMPSPLPPVAPGFVGDDGTVSPMGSTAQPREEPGWLYDMRQRDAAFYGANTKGAWSPEGVQAVNQTRFESMPPNPQYAGLAYPDWRVQLGPIAGDNVRFHELQHQAQTHNPSVDMENFSSTLVGNRWDDYPDFNRAQYDAIQFTNQRNIEDPRTYWMEVYATIPMFMSQDAVQTLPPEIHKFYPHLNRSWGWGKK